MVPRVVAGTVPSTAGATAVARRIGTPRSANLLGGQVDETTRLHVRRNSAGVSVHDASRWDSHNRNSPRSPDSPDLCRKP